MNTHVSLTTHHIQIYYQFPETARKAAVMNDHIVKLTKTNNTSLKKRMIY